MSCVGLLIYFGMMDSDVITIEIAPDRCKQQRYRGARLVQW